MSGGYQDCACNDCFEIAIGEVGALCHACKTAGCETAGERTGNAAAECLAPHTYCEADSSYTSDGDSCAVCGLPF
jgi:hypothetical protein